MILTSSNTLVTKEIIEYRGLVTGESLIGANIYKDLFSGVRDVVGGRTSKYEEELKKARETTLALLEMGMSVKQIAKAVNLSVETIQNWISEA